MDESRATPIPSLSKRVALKIGLQIEKLVDAVDAKDSARLAAMASRVRATAIERGILPIVEATARLERAVASRGDWLETLELASELLDLCRTTQGSYLDTYDVEKVPKSRPGVDAPSEGPCPTCADPLTIQYCGAIS
jgi:hypothetical protein